MGARLAARRFQYGNHVRVSDLTCGFCAHRPDRAYVLRVGCSLNQTIAKISTLRDIEDSHLPHDHKAFGLCARAAAHPDKVHSA